MTIPRELIDADADKVVRRLARASHTAYLVGGCVRDLLLRRKPKDFDVATSATPKEIKELFRNCRIIGRRFRLAHVFFGQKIIETSTFRANPREGMEVSDDDDVLIRRDNVFGSDTEDARRRDFTINGLFYDVEQEVVIDHVGGLADLEARLVRTIGDPDIRFREDPVRMLRAIKFAARLDFAIEPETYAALLRQRDEILKCAPPRLLEEFYRLLRGGAALRSVELLLETGLADVLIPQLTVLYGGRAPRTVVVPVAAAPEGAVANEPGAVPAATAPTPAAAEAAPAATEPTPADAPPAPPLPILVRLAAGELDRRRALAWSLLDHIDARAAAGEPFTNALVLSAVVGPFVIDDLVAPGIRPLEANEVVMEVLEPLIEQIHIARRDAERTRQILLGQRRLVPARRRRGRPMAMVRRDYFDEALALYELTTAASGSDPEDMVKWRKLQREDGVREAEAVATGSDGAEEPRRKRRRRRGGRRRRRTTSELETVSAGPGQGETAGG